MNNIFGIVGGDLRIAYLAELLANEQEIVYVYGLENYNFRNKNIVVCKDLEKVMNVDKVITAIPFSKDNKSINTTYSNKEILIEDFFNKLENKKIFSGALNSDILEIANKRNIELVDLLKIEELAILNAIPTAEGAIQMAMSKTNITLHNSNCLVMGFGRIGKILTKMLNGIGANVYCEARNNKDIAQIISYNYNAIRIQDLEDKLYKFDFIFNTIPYLILTEEKLTKINKDCLIIDLASAPGGIDFEVARNLGLTASLELALPGRVAPKTSAKYIKQILEKM